MSGPTKDDLLEQADKVGAHASKGDTKPEIEKAIKKAEKNLGDAVKFADDEYRLEQILDHAHLFFEDTPKFLVEQALRADGKSVYTLADAQSVVEQFTATTPED